MKIGNHGLREHIHLLMPLFGLIAAVWLLRIVMDKAGTPPAVVRMVSVTVAGAGSVLLAVLLIHFKAFGSYPNVVAAAFLLECWQQLLICGAIAFSVLPAQRISIPRRSIPREAANWLTSSAT